jgi:CRISPR-associated Csx3 family protein
MKVILRKQDIPSAEKPPIVLEIILTTGLMETKELPQLLEVVANNLPAGGEEGVIISGRLPVWAFSALIHYFHPRPWVATFDPRLGGGVVAATHTPDVSIGEIIPVTPDLPKVTIGFPKAVISNAARVPAETNGAKENHYPIGATKGW